MLRSTVIFLLGMLVMNNTNAQQFPSLKEVINVFYTHYSFESVESLPRFEKRKDGWYITEEEYASQGNHINPALFWSAKENKFLAINYPISQSDSSEQREKIATYLSQIDIAFEEGQFKLHKYYGYPGWAWDIINDSTDKGTMTDADWESQARACSNYAAGFIAEQYGNLFENNDPDRAALTPTATISKTRIDKFIYYENKAIDAFNKLMELNPRYQTTVGNINIKCANEYMYAYSEMMLAEDAVAARKFAAKASYPDSLISLYKPMLGSLPANSILVAGGDNDTYTFWYLQEVQQFRKDVTVLNVSLLGFRRYLVVNNKNHHGRLFSTPDSIISKNNFDYFVYSNKTEKPFKLSVPEFIYNLNRNNNPYNSYDIPYSSEPLKTYYAKELHFIPSIKNTDPRIKTKLSKVVRLKEYLYMNDFILLDLINNNILSRSIFFSFPYHFFDELLEYKKPVFEIIPFKK